MITNIWYKSKNSAVPWQPTDITGCQLWLKADAGITKDGSNYVSAWADHSGNGNDALQASGSAQPLWVNDVFNGKPSINFSLGNMLTVSSTISVGSIFIVCNHNQPPYPYFTNYKILIENATYPYLIFGNSGTTKIIAYYISGNTTYMNGNVSDDFSPLSSYKLLELCFNPITMNSVNISSASVYSWIGNISEIIFYDTKLNATDRQLVENYINTKYALW